MSFRSGNIDRLFCHECDAVLSLDEYRRRVGLCLRCEVEQADEQVPDTIPEWMEREAA